MCFVAHTFESDLVGLQTASLSNTLWSSGRECADSTNPAGCLGCWVMIILFNYYALDSSRWSDVCPQQRWQWKLCAHQATERWARSSGTKDVLLKQSTDEGLNTSLIASNFTCTYSHASLRMHYNCTSTDMIKLVLRRQAVAYFGQCFTGVS